MAKSPSPIRLDNNLMHAATVAGAKLHRTAPEQIEYWAEIGRKCAKFIDPETLLDLQAGFVSINIEEQPKVSIDSNAVFTALAAKRDSGALSQAISSGRLRYQASRSHPGMLEACYPDGRVVVGQFNDGEFRALDS